MVRMFRTALALVALTATSGIAKSVDVPIDLKIADVTGNVGEIVNVPIDVTSPALTTSDSVISYEFDVDFDRTVLEPVGVVVEGTFSAEELILNNLTTLQQNPDSSVWRFAAAVANPYTGVLPLAILQFEIVGGPGDVGVIGFVEAKFNEAPHYLGTLIGGSVEVNNLAPSINLEVEGTVTIPEGQTFEMLVTGTDPDGQLPPDLFAVLTPTDEFSFSPVEGSGLFSWTPGFGVTGAEQTASYDVTFTAVDENQDESSKSLRIVVVNTNRAPSIEPTTPVVVNEGDEVLITANASDPDGDVLRLRVSPQPLGAKIDGLTFLWKPTQEDVGVHVFTFTVWDRQVFLRPSREADFPQSASTQVTVTVEDVNYAPVLSTIGDVTLSDGESFQLFVSARDPDGDAITFADNTALFDVDPLKGIATYTAIKGDAGSHTITITATDGQETAQETFILTVEADNRPPVFKNLPLVVDRTTTTATIEWLTSEPATSVINYGLVSGARDQNFTDLTLSTKHTVTLTGLQAGITYAYEVKSADESNNVATAPLNSFTTKQLPPPALEITSDPVVIDRGTSHLTISWKTNVRATTVIQFGTSDAALTTSVVGPSGEAHSVTINGLIPATQYFFRAVSIDAASQIVRSEIGNETTKTQQTAPTVSNPVISAKSQTSFTVQWSTNRSATSIVQYGATETLTRTVVTDTGSAVTDFHNVTVTGLEAGTKYFYRVGSKGPEGLGPTFSRIVDVYTERVLDQTGPQILTGPKAVGITHEEATVFWTTDEAASEIVEYGALPASGPFVYTDKKVQQARVLKHNVLITGLAPSTVYGYRVRTTDQLGNETVSELDLFTSADAPDAKPPVLSGDVYTSSIGDVSVIISWATDERSDSRAVYSTQGGVADKEFVSDLVQKHDMEIVGLLSDTHYSATVTSRDASGNEMQPVAISFTTKPVPDVLAPSITGFPRVESQTLIDDIFVNVALVVDVNEPAAVTADLYVHPDSAVSQFATTDYETTQRLTFTQLQAATRYFYQLTLVDGAGNVSVDKERSFLTIEGNDVKRPRIQVGPVTTNTGETQFSVAWETDEAANGELFVGKVGDGSMVSVAVDLEPKTVHELTATNLTPGTDYLWRIVTIDPAGNVTKSGVQIESTLDQPDEVAPVFVSNPAVRYTTTDRAIVTWETDEETRGEVFYAVENDEYFDVAHDLKYKKRHGLTLANLQRGASYVYFVRAVDSQRNEAIAGDTLATEFGPLFVVKLANGRYKISQPGRGGSFNTPVAPDVTFPEINEAPKVTDAGTGDATITWGTDEVANSIIRIMVPPAPKPARGAAVNLDTLLLTEGTEYADAEWETGHLLRVTGLEPSTTYMLHVASTDPSSNGETRSQVMYLTTTAEVDLDPPEIVEGSVRASASESQASISWETNELATSQVDYGTDVLDLDMTRTDAEPRTNQSIVLTGLNPGTNYYYRVSSTDARGNGPTSGSILSFVTAAVADIIPPVLSDVVIVAVTNKTATVEWVTNEPADTFIEYGTSDAYGQTFYDPATSEDHRATLTGMLSNVEYHFKIVASDRAGNQFEGPDSTLTTSAEADTVGPDAPTAVDTVAGSGRVVLRWAKSPSPDAESYTVFRDDAVLASAVGDTEYVDPSVTNGVKYVYEIAGTDAVGNLGAKTAAVSETPSESESPTAPILQSPIGLITGSAQLTMTVSNVTRAASRTGVAPTYSFVVATDEELNTVIASGSGVTEGTNLTSYSVEGTSLEEDATYYWAARADDGIVSGPISDVTSFTWGAVAVQLQAFNATGTQSGSVELDWILAGEADQIAGVELLRGDDPSNALTVKSFGREGLENQFIDPRVAPGVDIRYWLRVTENSGEAALFGPVDAIVALPKQWTLSPAYPNPFNPVTQINLAVPEAGEASVIVYNVIGQPVQTLWSGPITPGMHTLLWNGKDQVGRSVASGVYIIRATTKTGFAMNRRVTMIR
jgi:phosphodiesterase/alkaline phosphatase D-like protein